MAYGGFKNWRLGGGIINLFDKTPPFSETNLLNNQHSQEGFAELYSVRDQFFHVEGPTRSSDGVRPARILSIPAVSDCDFGHGGYCCGFHGR